MPDTANAFEADLRRVLQDASPSGRFSVRQPGTEVFVWHQGQAAVPRTAT